MKKLLAGLAVLSVVVALPVVAATSWAPLSSGVPVYARGAQGTFTAANGTDPSLATTTTAALGLELKGLGGLVVMAETAGGGNMTSGGKFLAYLWNPATSKWEQVADGSLDLTSSAVARQAWPGFSVTSDMSRIAWEPSGIGTAVNLYIFGTSRVLTPR